eukprot:TRINITY_DN7833_c0_g5_i1.p4 TRINITY_DN7833_c0_g5~~TRINITY_DN7833_c0_g5_i1.p4  ORF type:complete len:134 (-),score=25.26 TRINITY_DN7833_c0_g5_i1:211-612(-)
MGNSLFVLSIRGAPRYRSVSLAVDQNALHSSCSSCRGLLSTGGSAVPVVLEEFDMPLLPCLALVLLCLAFGTNLLRFCMTGSIYSAIGEDSLFNVNLKYGTFSLNAFIGYATSVLSVLPDDGQDDPDPANTVL